MADIRTYLKRHKGGLKDLNFIDQVMWAPPSLLGANKHRKAYWERTKCREAFQKAWNSKDEDLTGFQEGSKM